MHLMSKISRKLRQRYKCSISNLSTDDEVIKFRISILHFISIFVIISVLLISFTVLIISTTDLKEYIPGYPSKSVRPMLVSNVLKIDSLRMELNKRDKFINSIKYMLKIENKDTLEVAIPDVDTTENLYDTIPFTIDSVESEFRNEIEQKEKFNLGFGLRKGNKDIKQFFNPVYGGYISRKFEKNIQHYGVDIVAKKNTEVKAVMDGIVIFSDWTLKTGYVIAIQHANNIISVYKHNSVLMKKEGEYIIGGEVIAIVGNTGDLTSGPHLHFELWCSGNPIDPEEVIKFK